MNDHFQVRFDWLDRNSGDAATQAVSAQLSIEASGVNLTELEDISARTIRGGFRASAYPLALWLAANWWRLLWETEGTGRGHAQTLDWRMSHEIASAGGGYAWPPIRIVSDGAAVRLSVWPPRAHPVEPV